jgi:hypothetical protein
VSVNADEGQLGRQFLVDVDADDFVLVDRSSFSDIDVIGVGNSLSVDGTVMDNSLRDISLRILEPKARSVADTAVNPISPCYRDGRRARSRVQRAGEWVSVGLDVDSSQSA